MSNSKMNKKIIFLGSADGKSREEFHEYYINELAPAISENEKIQQYYANKIIVPSQELIDAGWGWGGYDDSGIFAMDEIWCDDDMDVLSLYSGNSVVNILGAYNTEEVVYRPTLAKWETGVKSPWVKRIGLLKCQDGQRPIDFFRYWEKGHAPLALKTHIGAGFYGQQHFYETLVPAKIAWNGMCILDYWSIDAFRFAHFSYPGAMEKIKTDCAAFLDVFYSMCGEEYVMKRKEGYIDAVFSEFERTTAHDL